MCKIQVIKQIKATIFMLLLLIYSNLTHGQNNLISRYNSTFKDELLCGLDFNDNSLFIGNKENALGDKSLTIYKLKGTAITQEFFYNLPDTSLYSSQAFTLNGLIHVWGLGEISDSTYKSFVFHFVIDSTFKLQFKEFISVPKVAYLETIKVKQIADKTILLLTGDTSLSATKKGITKQAIIFLKSDTLVKTKIITAPSGRVYGRDIALTSNGFKIFITDGAITNIANFNFNLENQSIDSLVYLDNYLSSPILSFINHQSFQDNKYLLSGSSDSLLANFSTTQRFSITVFDSLNKPLKRIGFGNNAFEDGLKNTSMKAVLAFNNNLIHNEYTHHYLLAGNWVNRFDLWQFQSNQSVIYCLDSSFNLIWTHNIQIPDTSIFLYSILPIKKETFIIGNITPVGSLNYKWDMLLLKIDENGVMTRLSNIEKLNAHIILFPNPTSSKLFITNLPKSPLEVFIINNKGQKQNIQYQTSNTNLEIDLKDFSEGVYYIKVICEEGFVYSSKIIKRNSE